MDFVKGLKIRTLLVSGFFFMVLFIVFIVFAGINGLNSVYQNSEMSGKMNLFVAELKQLKLMKENFVKTKKPFIEMAINKKINNLSEFMEEIINNTKESDILNKFKKLKNFKKQYLEGLKLYKKNGEVQQLNVVEAKSLNLAKEIATHFSKRANSYFKYTKHSSLIFLVFVILLSIFGAFLIVYLVSLGINNLLKQSSLVKESVELGDFSIEIPENELSKDFKEIGFAFNTILESVKVPIQITENLISKIASGNSVKKIENKFEGDLGKIIDSLNSLIAVNDVIIKNAEEIANGNLNIKIVPRSENDKLLIAFKNMINNTKELVEQLGENIQSIADSSNELSKISQKLSTGAIKVSEQVISAGGASEQLSANIAGIATSSEEMSINSANVARNAKNMSEEIEKTTVELNSLVESIESVAENANEALEITTKATDESKKATKEMEQLNIAAQEIDKVTEMIKEIAGQTNLLALNATIEAASAGEAGKGFAVVANEIKELARQSASAAEEIAEKINDVQSRTTISVDEMFKVNEIIEKINDKIRNINNAVEKESVVANKVDAVLIENTNSMKEVASLVAEITTTVEMMSKNTSEGAKATSEVSQTMLEIENVAQETVDGANKVASSASELSIMAQILRRLIDNFKI